MAWKPGQSGNPAGRPIGSGMLTDALRRHLDVEGEDGRSKADRLAEVIVSAALEGNPQAWKICWERIEGRVIEPPADPEQKLIIEVRRTPKPLPRDESRDMRQRDEESDSD